MFFNDSDAHPRRPIQARGYALLLGTALATGTVGMAGLGLVTPAFGADYNLNVTAPRGNIEAYQVGAGKVTITSSSGGTISSNNGSDTVVTETDTGAIDLTFDGAVIAGGASGAAVSGYTSSGAFTLKGAGAISSSVAARSTSRLVRARSRFRAPGRQHPQAVTESSRSPGARAKSSSTGQALSLRERSESVPATIPAPVSFPFMESERFPPVKRRSSRALI